MFKNLIFKTFAVIVYGLFFFSQLSSAQDEEESSKQTTVLDRSPYLSPRAEGMGGALSGVANGIDSVYYNPAAIGGIHERKSPPFIRQLHFPYIGASVNKNSQEMLSEMQKEGADTDKAIGSAIIDAHADKRQYGRLSLFPNVVFGRMMAGLLYDQQIAAVPKGDNTDLVNLQQRNLSGFTTGASVSDPRGNFYLGVSTAYISRTDIKGEFVYSEFIDKKQRQDLIKDNKSQYQGVATNVGMIWVIGKNAKPAISVVAKDLGSTTYKNVSSGEQADDSNLVEKQDLTMGFSVSPQLGKGNNFFNFVVEGGNLEDPELSIVQKLRTGMELTLGNGFGSQSVLGIRAGYSYAGPSAGLNLNIGLIGIQGSIYNVDIGEGNEKIVEQRTSAVFSINIGEY